VTAGADEREFAAAVATIQIMELEAELESMRDALSDAAADRGELSAERDALAAERDALVAERDALAVERDAPAARVRLLGSASEQREALQTLSDAELDARARALAGAADVVRDVFATRVSERRLCVVCQDRERAVMLQPCNHVCVCAECAAELPAPRLCPVCRAGVEREVRAFL
jgi:hypothetical protein